MHLSSIKLLPFLMCQLLVTIASSGVAFAQVSVSPTDGMQRIPVGAIESVDMADQSLHEAKQKRLITDQQFTQEKYACYEKFFANSCIQDAKERRHVALKEIRTVEIDANAFKRRARIKERNQEVAEKSMERQHERNERSDAPAKDENGLFKR